MKYFLDTNMIIYAVKGAYPSIMKHIASMPTENIVIPSMVLAEIEYGARKSKDYNKTISKYKAFTSNFMTISFKEPSDFHYGIIRSSLEKAGETIGYNDYIIAATVLANDGILVTHNTKEFLRIPGLNVEDWTEE